jgi:Protein of unknown function (DUF1616)
VNILSFEKPVLYTAIGLVAAFLILAAGLIWAFWPAYEEQFIEFGLLGKNKMAEDYFTDVNSTITMGSQLDWYIYIHNHMGNSQTVIVRVKLLNSTMEIPNNQKHEPSPYPSLDELPLTLSNNETLLLPFSWAITGLERQDNSVLINQLAINSETFVAHVSTPSNSFFRIVFELWVYNSSTKEYEFGWTSGEEFSSASLYLGFRV